MTTGVILPQVRRKRSTLHTVLIILAICAAGAVLLLALVFSMLSRSDAARMGTETLQSSPQAVALLGAPVNRGWLVTGAINVNGGSGSADLAIPVSGSQHSGKLYLNAKKYLGQWKITAAELEVDGVPQRLTLVKSEPGPVD